MKRIVKLMLISCLVLIIGAFALTSCEELLGTSTNPDETDHVHTVVADKAVSPTCTEDGLAESGKHEELVAKGGIYSELYRMYSNM